MFGAIVLRDIPKEEVRIDLARFPIQGGFRGFAQVPPGLHYVSVKNRQHHVGFWGWLKPQAAIVKVFDYEKGFADDAPEGVAQYTGLALSGAMGPALMPYPAEKFGPWFGLVMHLAEANFPPSLKAEESGGGSRFEKAFQGTHGGQPGAFLAEFQYAFVRWLVSLDTAAPDEAALARWRHLLLTAYNAGDHNISQAGDLFPQLVDTLLRQFPLLPEDWFSGDSFLTKQAKYMVEDMTDAGGAQNIEKAQAFAAYLKTRTA